MDRIRYPSKLLSLAEAKKSGKDASHWNHRFELAGPFAGIMSNRMVRLEKRIKQRRAFFSCLCNIVNFVGPLTRVAVDDLIGCCGIFTPPSR